MRIFLSNGVLAAIACGGSVLAILLGTVDVFGDPAREVFDRWRWCYGACFMTLVTFMLSYACRYLEQKSGWAQTTKGHIEVTSVGVAVMYWIFVLPFAPSYDTYRDITGLDVAPALLGLSALHVAIFYLIGNKEAGIRVSGGEYAGVLAVAFLFALFSRLLVRLWGFL